MPGITTASGEQAYLFSSTESSVVHRHFQWMREHDIDGVLLQRFSEAFMSKNPDGTFSGPSQWPLVNAREAAHREGRTWAIEYDIQNAGNAAARDARIQQVKDDWEFLTDPNGFDMLNDSHYQRENGKPVVAIFGLYVTSNNSYTTAQQTDLINYFQVAGRLRRWGRPPHPVRRANGQCGLARRLHPLAGVLGERQNRTLRTRHSWTASRNTFRMCSRVFLDALAEQQRGDLRRSRRRRVLLANAQRRRQ